LNKAKFKAHFSSVIALQDSVLLAKLRCTEDTVPQAMEECLRLLTI